VSDAIDLSKLPEGVRAVVSRVLGGVGANKDFVEKFECPIRRGEQPRCTSNGDVPEVPAPLGTVPCPVWEGEKCFRWTEWVRGTEAREQQEWLRDVKVMGVPARFWEVSLATSEATGPYEGAMHAAREYLEAGLKAGRCLKLLGPNGRGKTHVAVCMLRAGRGVRSRRFLHYPSLANELYDLGRRAGALERAKTDGLVVFDDFGSEYLTGASNRSSIPTTFVPALMAYFDEIIWHRYENVLPTIITSRLTPEEFDDRITDNVVSRLATSWVMEFHVSGQDLREGT
jgi:hypothetical protein